jgi:hypothetical protein
VHPGKVGDERAETYLRLRAAGEPLTLDDGMQAFWLRLTPPLATLTDAVEVVVTGPAARVRATVPVRSR